MSRTQVVEIFLKYLFEDFEIYFRKIKKLRFTKIHIVVLALLSFVLIAAEDGVGEDQNKDRSGSPDGANLCSHCHDSGSFSPEITLRVLNENNEEVSEYIPGTTYLLKYKVVSTESSATVYGFQGTALSENNMNRGEFSNPGVQTQLESVTNISLTNRKVVEHSSPSASGNWEVNWTAPESNSGNVKFYFAGVGANGNGMSTGDGFDRGVLTLTEDTDALIGILESPKGWNLESAENGFKLISNSALNGLAQVQIYSITGALISSEGFSQEEVDLTSMNFAQGINIISVSSNNTVQQFQVYF